MLKWIFLILSVCPLLWEVRRLHKIWAFSPLDRYDACYMLLGLLGVAYLAWRHAGKEAGKRDLFAIFLVLPLVLVGLAGMMIPLNVLYFIGGIGIGYAMIWLLWGWAIFWRLAPACVWMGLAVPTSSIAVMIPDFSGWLWLKLSIAFLIFLYIILAEFLDLCPRPGQGFFYLGMVLLVFILMIGMPKALVGDSFELDTGDNVFQDYIGAVVPLTGFDKRFFSGCRNVERLRFVAPDNDSFISLLEIESGDNVHNIHPAVVCLRSMGWRIVRTGQKTMQIRNRTLAYDEIRADSEEGRHYLIYVWYSGSRESSGSFFHFRKNWTNSRRWKIYQLMVPIPRDNVKAAERLLYQFMTAFGPREKTTANSKMNSPGAMHAGDRESVNNFESRWTTTGAKPLTREECVAFFRSKAELEGRGMEPNFNKIQKMELVER